jgi:hypothetical protein
VDFLHNIKKKLRQSGHAAQLRLKCVLLWFKCQHEREAFELYVKTKPENSPVFIVGCGHSGTSYLLAVLGTHSRIYPVPKETKLAYDYDEDVPALSPNADLMVRSFDLQTIAAKKKRWIEKTPKHIESIPLLRKFLPGAKFLIMLRDGRDVASSIEARVGSLEVGIQRWVKDNRAAQPFWHDADVHVLKYEDMVVDFAGTIKAALKFLGEDFEPQVLRSYEKPKYFYSNKIERPPDESQKNHDQYRNWQINQKLFDGRGKWKQLSDEKKALIKRVAGDMLVEYGYATDLNW